MPEKGGLVYPAIRILAKPSCQTAEAHKVLPAIGDTRWRCRWDEARHRISVPVEAERWRGKHKGGAVVSYEAAYVVPGRIALNR